MSGNFEIWLLSFKWILKVKLRPRVFLWLKGPHHLGFAELVTQLQMRLRREGRWVGTLTWVRVRGAPNVARDNGAPVVATWRPPVCELVKLILSWASISRAPPQTLSSPLMCWLLCPTVPALTSCTSWELQTRTAGTSRCRILSNLLRHLLKTWILCTKITTVTNGYDIQLMSQYQKYL